MDSPAKKRNPQRKAKDSEDDQSSDHPLSQSETSNQSPEHNTDPENTSNCDASNEPNRDPAANHGRHSAADYSGCSEVDVPFEDEHLKQGFCPECAQYNTSAKIYPTSQVPQIVLLTGSPLVSGERYCLASARCSVCQKRFSAPLPAQLKGTEKYDKSCYTTIAIHHYYAGLPFKRIEMLQSAQHIPLADATQYDLMQRLYHQTVKPVCQVLAHYAAQGDRVWFDDTPQRVLSQIALNKAVDKRKNKKSVYATVFLSQYQDHFIYLFRTSTLTAGSELKQLLSQRETSDEFISMSDASSSNFPKLEELLLCRWVITLCLVHGRRNFAELTDDEEAQFVLSIIAQVYQHEAHCKKQAWNDQERLSYHQKKSAPLLESLRIWLNNLILHNRVEPNSAMGNAIAYLLKRWKWLTQFLRVPGAPLDNNIAEQSVKVIIRYRKTSYFYRTFLGARIGDAMMGLLHTTAKAQVSIFDYLNHLQYYSLQVNASPEKWLPWNYQETIQQLETQTPACEVLNSS